MDNNLTITNRSLDDLTRFYRSDDLGLNWNLVFTLPAWLKVWWQNFNAGAELLISSVHQGKKVLGIAPLQVIGNTASFIGNVDVCDYLDFIVAPGLELLFFNSLLDDLTRNGIQELVLETIRPDSNVANYLMPLARERGCQVEYQPADVSSVMTLPQSWDEYLSGLDGKQRHELKRKIRNLDNLGEVRYRCVSEKPEIQPAVDSFLRLFPESRNDKARFMTPAMQAYFRDLSLSLADAGVIRFGILELNANIVAMVMYFDYNNIIYLYNSAYDPAYRSSSVGIISKAACIRDSIEKGKHLFDFLKGPEVYKTYMGGRTLPLFRCRINL